MVVQVLLAFQLFSAPIDRTRAAELSEMASKERIRAQAHEATARAEMQRQRFEQRFNKLVDAVAAFANEYNEGKGQVGPSAEAAKLRKAMSELQAFEESLGGKSPRTPTCATRPM